MEKLANPRLIDVFGSNFTQDDVEFAIPKLQEDIPLYVDPFLLWNSPKAEYRVLHEHLINFFRILSLRARQGDVSGAAQLLAGCEEPRAMGLGYGSGTKRGSNIGPKLIADIIASHDVIPQLKNGDLRHIEELQLVVPGVAEDRISDTACSILKEYFIEFTSTQAKLLSIPTKPFFLGNVYDSVKETWIPSPQTHLP